jgi:hypothetical protein
MNDFIRNDSHITSCTITDVKSNGNATVEFEHFKEARYDVSYIVIYEYEHEYYYPIALEYRLIDNNIFAILCKDYEKRNYSKGYLRRRN